MSDLKEDKQARKRSSDWYYNLCMVIYAAFLYTASSAIHAGLLAAGVIFVIGVVLAIIFAQNADKSSWQPLRDIQTTS